MTFKVVERVRETTTTTGTGTYTLAGVVAGMQAVSDIGANNYSSFISWRPDDTNWESFIGRYLASPDRVERTTIKDSSTGSAIDWGPGTTYIEIVPPAWLDLFPVLSKSVAGSSNVDLTQDEMRRRILIFTGTLTGNIEVRVDDTPWEWIVYNNTAGAFTLTFKTSGGTGKLVTQGKRAMLACDGTNVVSAHDDPISQVVPVMFSCGPQDVGPGGTSYFGLAWANADPSKVIFPAPYTGTLRNLRLQSGAAPGGGETFTYTLQKGGDTALTCQTSGAGSSVSSDLTHSVAVTAGDVLSMKLVTSGGAAQTFHSAALVLEVG